MALLDWFDALEVGGSVEIIVPNLDFHIEQWQTADWSSESTESTQDSQPRWAFAGLYGWQRQCNPNGKDYTQVYWDVHKSGYNERRMRHLLSEAGYSKVKIEIVDRCHLVARATKLTKKIERQVAPRLEGIRADHVARYRFAEAYLKPDSVVGDFACGVGYGAFLLANNECVAAIDAVDIDRGAIEYAAEHYADRKIAFSQGDLTGMPLGDNRFDLITSFETIEHLEEPHGFLESVLRALRPGGIFICSTPNEDVLPLATMRNPYHFRHYTPAQFAELLTEVGFQLLDRKSQSDRESSEIDEGWHGLYNIAVCEKIDDGGTQHGRGSVE